MSTSIDGAPPSTAPEPPEVPGRGGPDRGEQPAAESGSMWLQEEIARRIAAKSSGSGGRHARRDNPDPSTAAGYGTNGAPGIPRHATAIPGPAAVAPPPVGGHPPARKLPRRGPAGANGDTEAWTGPDRSRDRRPVVGGPSLPAAGSPARRPSGAAAARLLSPPPSTSPPSPAPPRAAPSVSAPDVAGPPAAPPTGGWPVPTGTPDGYADPGPLTGPVRDAPGADAPDEILWSASALPPAPVEVARVDTPAPGTVAVPEQRGDPASGREAPGTDGPRGTRFSRDGADPEPPKRVRVVLAERKGLARPVRTVVDIQEATAVGELLRSNLIGSQLVVALRFAAAAGVTLGILPLLFALFPAIGEFGLFGLRLPWLLLGFLVYPFLFGLGWWHTRTAERVEQNFADHVQE